MQTQKSPRRPNESMKKPNYIENLHCSKVSKFDYTVLGVKISHGHDHTSCATLGHFEMEFWCGTCRYDTQAQCSVQSFIVRTAHFGARMLKVRPTGEGGTPKRLKIQGAGIVPWKFQCISSTFAPWKSLIFSLFGEPPSPVGLTLSILAPKWAVLTMKLCTEHCAWVSYVHVPHQNSTSKCPSVAHEVWSCLWLIFTPRTVYLRNRARRHEEGCSKWERVLRRNENDLTLVPSNKMRALL